MSNLIGHNLIHHNLLAHVVLEHQSKINSSCISGYNLFQVQANSQIRKSHITSKFWGKCLNLRKTKLPMGTNLVLSVFPQSVLATDPTSKQLTESSTLMEIRNYRTICFQIFLAMLASLQMSLLGFKEIQYA